MSLILVVAMLAMSHEVDVDVLLGGMIAILAPRDELVRFGTDGVGRFVDTLRVFGSISGPEVGDAMDTMAVSSLSGIGFGVGDDIPGPRSIWVVVVDPDLASG
jgi:hypothetical protein